MLGAYLRSQERALQPRTALWLNSSARPSDSGIMPIRRIDVHATTIGLALACCLLLTTAACAPRSGEPGFVSSFLRTLVARALSDGPTDASLTTKEPAASATPLASQATTTPADTLAGEEIDDPEEGMCEWTYSGVVTIVSLRDERGLGRAIAGRGEIPVVYRSADTVVYEDGQVLTTKVENVTAPLSELGWSGNPIRLLGSATSSSTRGSASSWSWNGARPDGTFKPRRTRRRG